MGSEYAVSGQRCDYHLFLDHDGRYERSERSEPDYDERQRGHWIIAWATFTRICD
jgi:hypothetical protein